MMYYEDGDKDVSSHLRPYCVPKYKYLPLPRILNLGQNEYK